MANSLLESIPDNIAGDVAGFVDDLVAVVIEGHPTHFLNAHYITVDGADHPIFRFDFDTDAFIIALKIKYRAALATTRME